MKFLIIFLLLSLITSTVYSQVESPVDTKSSRQLNKIQRQEIRKAEEAAMARVVDSLIKIRRFVLEADFLSNQTGRRIMVSNLLNFIIVDSSEIVIQIASTQGVGGPNGMGGITARGRITSFDMKKMGKKEGYYSIRLMAMTSVGSYDIFLNISPNSNADATISGITYGKLNYHGQIKAREKSRVYKGMSI